jgi:hypothetical protein
MNYIKAFKLTNNDEIIGRVIEENHGLTLSSDGLTSDVDGKIISYTVERPHLLALQQGADGRMGLALIPWTLANPSIEEVELPASMVVLSYDCAKHVEDNYVSQTSKIDLSTKISL